MNSDNKQSKRDLNRKAAKAGAFFVVVQFLVRGVTFLVTPIYARLVSKAQYGEIRVYESWLLILVPLLSLCLYKSIARAKFDYSDEYDEYVASIQGLSYIVMFAFYLISTIFFRKIIMDFMGMNNLLYAFMVLYTFAHCSVFYFQVKENQMMRYKQNVLLTACMMFPATVLSIVLLYWGKTHQMQNMLVDLRVIGYYTPQIIGGLLAGFIIWKRGGFHVRKKYWKYALAFSVPLIPEAISIQIMNQSDKIMVQKMVGNDVTGVFSLAATISFIIWVIEDAVWTAWMPWLYEKFDRGEIADIQKPWNLITYIFSYFSWSLVILAPELIYILGGTKYKEAVFLVAPMVTGVLFRFFSYIFTSVKNYKKKTKASALGTVSAMLINVILNAICIKYMGYQAAAYTTAFSYLMLLILQGYLEKKVCGTRCVSFGMMVLQSIVLWGINQLTIFTYYTNIFVRWSIFIVVSIFVLWKIYPNINIIRKQFRK